MKKNIILTSAVAMFVAMPAMAEPSNTGTFPSDGKMQADYTYTNAATSDNMAGVYENSVYANAQYTTNDYTVNAGFYLPADSENPNTTCTAGSFCPGLQSPVQYNATTAQGITACPTGYTNSATGAKANTECYRTCEIANNGTTFTNIAHATAVSGNDYYNTTATDTCEPTACENGWHVLSGFNPATSLPATGTGAPAGTDYVARGADGTYCNYDEGCMGDEDWDATDLANLQSLGLSNGEFRVTYGSGSVTGELRGIGQCSTQSGTGIWSNPAASTPSDVTTMATLPNSSGQYCWCKATGWQATNGAMQSLSAPWVFSDDYGGAGDCAGDCANNCAGILQNGRADHLAFRAAVFGSLGASPAVCEANTITITWSDADAADISANNAGVVTYGGDVRTPVKAQTKKGKTFSGWVFSTTAPSNE